MRRSASARRYARALFSLAKEDGSAGVVRESIEQLDTLFDESAELRIALLTPLYPARERKAVLSALAERAGLSELVQRFYGLLIDHRRLVDFKAVRDEYERLFEEDSGLLTAQVVSASPLDDANRARLRSALSARTGCDVKLELDVDSDLIGGAIAKVGDLIFDGSIRTQLEQLRGSLTKGS